MELVLFINIGNTNTAFGFSKKNDINDLKIVKRKTSELFNNDLENIFNSVKKELSINFSNIIISSVVSKLNSKLEHFFKKKNLPYHFISCENVNYLDLSNLNNRYELGSDLLAQMCYVCSFFDEAFVVSLGTTFVLYHVKNWKLSGCLIRPGLDQVKKIIMDTTDVGNFNFVNTKKILGSDTSEALSISCINDLENQINITMKKLKTKCSIICTGGSSKYFKKNKWWFIEDLEIYGLFMYYKNMNQ